MVNRVTLAGNLGRAPEVKVLENGAEVAKFSLATSESYKDKNGEWQNNTEWHDVVCWRSLANKAESLGKGDSIYLEGKLSTRTWEDKDGNNRRRTEVVASYFRSLSKKSSNHFPGPNDEPGETRPKDKESAEGDSLSF